MPSPASVTAAAQLVVKVAYRDLSVAELEQMLEHGRHFTFDPNARALNQEIELEIQRRRANGRADEES